MEELKKEINPWPTSAKKKNDVEPEAKFVSTAAAASVSSTSTCNVYGSTYGGTMGRYSPKLNESLESPNKPSGVNGSAFFSRSNDKSGRDYYKKNDFFGGFSSPSSFRPFGSFGSPKSFESSPKVGGFGFDNSSPRKRPCRNKTRSNRTCRNLYEKKQECYTCGSTQHLSKSCTARVSPKLTQIIKNRIESVFDCYKYDDSPKNEMNAKEDQKVDILAEKLKDIELYKSEVEPIVKTSTLPKIEIPEIRSGKFETPKVRQAPHNSLCSSRQDTARRKDYVNYDNYKQQCAVSNQKAKHEDYDTISTHRTIKSRSGEECEEWTCIRYPKNLPPNVKIITAHMLPPPK